MYRIILFTFVLIVLCVIIRGWWQRRESDSTAASKSRQSNIDKESIIEADFVDIEGTKDQ